jgi:hypothetical protein
MRLILLVSYLFFFNLSYGQTDIVNISLPDQLLDDDRLFAWNYKTKFKKDQFYYSIQRNISHYKLEINSQSDIQALYFAFKFSNVSAGSKLLITNTDLDTVFIYEFTKSSISKNILTTRLEATKLIIQIIDGNHNANEINFELAKIYVVPQDFDSMSNDDRFGLALPCNINTSCPLGADFEDQRKGACRIVMAHEEGLAYCTGSLVNNTGKDGTPYILSAFHCPYFLTPIYELWRFDFGFESDSCENSINSPPFRSLYGCEYVAGRLESDFLLLRLIDTILPSYGLYFNGWNYSMDSIPSYGTMLHHPRGDIMKISVDTHPLELIRTIINWGNGVITPPDHHIRALWDLGTMEKGSSGAGLWNSEKHIVGHLNGGSANCETLFRSNFGRFAMSWNKGDSSQTRLREWLDPEGNDPVKMDGMYLVDTTTYTIHWKVSTPDGIPLKKLYNEIIWPSHIQFIESDSGTYNLHGLKRIDSISFSTQMKDDPYNGVDFYDLRAISLHINNIEPIVNPYSLIAADVNRNNVVDHQDLFYILPNRGQHKEKLRYLEDWIFLPSEINITNPSQISDLGTIFGIKPGDVDFSRKIAED